MTKTNSTFRLGMISLGLVLLAIIAIAFVPKSPNTSAFLVGLPLMIAGVLACIGCLQIIAGRKEPKRAKFWIALIVNAWIALLFITMISVNLLDLAQAFGQ